MRVLFAVRSDLFKHVAGDTRQVESTRTALLNQGLQVDWATEVNGSKLTDYDLVHFFNITRVDGIYQLFCRAKELGIKTALTPIYWSLDSWQQYLDSRRYFAWMTQEELRRELVLNADIVLPGGIAEVVCLERDFGQILNYRIVICGTSFFCAKVCPVPGLVLCVARISPRKNQLALAKVCRELSLPLILAGPINNAKYMQEIERANPDVYLTGTKTDKELVSLYRLANVHVLPSWFETPGLSNLEAAACSCPIVTTKVGTAQEYFSNLAIYCQPGEFDNLKSALTEALARPRNTILQRKVKAEYTWTRAAEQTLAAYNEILGRRG